MAEAAFELVTPRADGDAVGIDLAALIRRVAEKGFGVLARLLTAAGVDQA